MENREVVLKTLLYADIFNYPLTKEEIFKYLISTKKIEKKEVIASLKTLKSLVSSKKNYYFIKGKDEIVNKRIVNEKISLNKIKIAKNIAKKISFLPFISFIGISGALSMKNSDINDDIDFFVISKKDSSWTTRFLLVIILSYMGVYRNRLSKNYSDKICLNMILDTNNFYFNNNIQNLYSAHEIVQLIPLFEREKTYENFIKANDWVNNYLSNAKEIKKVYFKKNNNILGKSVILIFKILFIEKLLQFIQFSYMKNRITKETIKKGFLAFHPFDYKTHILNEYRKKMRKYNLNN